MQEQIKSTPGLIEAIRQANEHMSIKFAEKTSNKQLDGAAMINIPIVVHVLESVSGQTSISDEQVLLTIDYVNFVFNGTHQSLSNDPVAAGNTGIQFIPARRTPEGGCTNGIDRIDASGFPGYATNGIDADANDIIISGGCPDLEIKNRTRWNPDKYYNIWLVNKINGENASSLTFTGGYTRPYPFLKDLDGIVLLLSEFADGKTRIVHELGHALGLYHPFNKSIEEGDSKKYGDCPPKENGFLTGDFISDTDPIDFPGDVTKNPPELNTKRRTGTPNICNDRKTFTIATENNFMNYTEPDEKEVNNPAYLFTQDQKNRMLQIIDYYRDNLILNGASWSLLPPEPNQIFNTCTNPELTTTNFKTITVGKDGFVWAGTNAGGLFKYSSNVWEKWGAYTNVNYQDMKTDRDGGVWVAQSGYTSSGYTAMTGGLLYFPNASFDSYTFYSVTQNGLPSRSARSLFIDTSRYNGPTTLPVVWAATWANNTAGVSAPGGIGRGVNLSAPQFNKITEGIDISSNTGGVFNIAGNSSEIWSFATNNNGYSQIIRHNSQTNAYIGAYDAATGHDLVSLVPEQFQAKGIYFDAKGNKWITVNGSGIIIQDKAGNWKKMNDVSLVGSSPFFNVNAIAGDSSGNVYFGTTNGLVFFKAENLVDDPKSYKLYTISDGLPNNNIQGISIDTLRKKILIATADGIAFWSPVCSTSGNTSKTYSTINSGNWETASNWCTGTVPTANDDVIVRHPITITVDTDVKSIKIIAPGSVTVAPGVKLNIRNP